MGSGHIQRRRVGPRERGDAGLAKIKVAILGGGMAGLSAAYQLSKTQTLRDQYEVVVYQLGWRLGGKAASGREVRRHDSECIPRNLEHGLHVWFGCYENVFQMLREVYDARGAGRGSKLATWQDAVKPQRYTPVGVLGNDGKWRYWPLTWPANDGVPGDGTLLPTWGQIIETVIGWLLEFVAEPEQGAPTEAPQVAGSPKLGSVLGAVREHLRSVGFCLFGRNKSKVGSALAAAREHLRSLGSSLFGQNERDLRHLVDLLGEARDANLAAGGQTMLHDVLEVFWAVVKGITEDLVLPDRPLESIDDRDFREWLCSHGANTKVVATSSVVRTVYDTLFQYEDGDVASPSYAAGAALGVIMRLVGTYKGSMMWELQAGMGEAVIAPIYEHLLGSVSFRFFRKVTSIELSADKKSVQTIRLDVQADTIAGDYMPTCPLDGLTVWPAEPLWDQLRDGDKMRDARVNFESHWCQWPAVRTETLERGLDFDRVILAISLGAYKPLNDEDQSMCAQLIEASEPFRDYVTNVGIVPSQGVQLWCDRSAAGLGWTTAKAATVAGPEYLDIWADMTQVLAFEPWPPPAPLSLHYLTGTYKTTLYRQPSSDTSVPATASQEIRQAAIEWLNKSSYAMWPRASSGDVFDWSVLHAPTSVTGEARFDAQFWRANIDPTECCTLSAARTTQYRLYPNETGFDNLFLAGEGTRHGFNTTTIEGAVMSGAAASRAICGEPAVIVGYDFLRRRPSEGPGT